jgi:hypothetical protein
MNSFLNPVEHDAREGFVVCVHCLRVQQGAASWVDAGEVIRRARTYELPAVPPLASGLCDDCSAEIGARRGVSHDSLAA